MKKEKVLSDSELLEQVKTNKMWARLSELEQDVFYNYVVYMTIEFNELKFSNEQLISACKAAFGAYIRGLGCCGKNWRRPDYVYAVSYEDGTEISRFELFEDALYQVNCMWDVDKTKAYIEKVLNDDPIRGDELC